MRGNKRCAKISGIKVNNMLTIVGYIRKYYFQSKINL